VPKSKVQPQNVAKLCGRSEKFNGILICHETGVNIFPSIDNYIHGIGN